MTPLHPLTRLIITKRAEIKALEAEPRKKMADRLNLAERSRYLGGLEDAAALTLDPEQLHVLLEDMR